MLFKYRFDLSNASIEEKQHILELIDLHSHTGAMFVSQSVADAFFEEGQDPANLIPVPDNCTLKKLSL